MLKVTQYKITEARSDGQNAVYYDMVMNHSPQSSAWGGGREDMGDIMGEPTMEGERI